MQDMLSHFGEIVHRKGEQAFPGLSRGQASHHAKAILDGLKADLDTAANSLKGEPARLLREARDTWKAKSEPLDQFKGAQIRKALRMNKNEDFEGIAKNLQAADDSQIEATFKLLNEHEPDTAALVRARFMEDAAESAGKAKRGATTARKEGTLEMKPGALVERLSKNEPKFRLAYAGDPKAQAMFDKTMALMKRLAVKPQKATPDAAGGGTLGKIGGVIATAALTARKILTDDTAMARALSSPEHMRYFQDLLRGAAAGKKISGKQSTAVHQALSRMAASGIVDPGE
jgi:hypothetical protein